jgi:hypothetical protein
MARHKLNKRVDVAGFTIVHHSVTSKQLEPIAANELKSLPTGEGRESSKIDKKHTLDIL